MKIAVTDNSNDRGTYLLTHVSHQADQTGTYYSSGASAPTFVYKNEFTCVPDALTYRPESKTPRPRILGTQTAVVVGPEVGGISTDANGRVKVRFHWDRQAAPDRIDPKIFDTSCWIRVLQSRAGQGWGDIELPRVGQEVVVDFLEGDPDRPIILGSVYNDVQTPPYALPEGKSVSGIKSRSLASEDAQTFNEIRLDDRLGSEQLVIQAQKDFSSIVKNDAEWDITRDCSWAIDRNANWAIGKNCLQYVGANKTTVVGLDGWFQPPLYITPPSYTSFIYAPCTEMVMPVRSQIVVGSMGLCFVDPTDYIVNKKLKFATIPGLKDIFELSTLLTGKTDFIYGNETRIQYGALHRDFVRGQKFHSVLKFSSENPLLKVLTGLHMALLTTATILPAIAFKMSNTASPSFTSGKMADQIIAAQSFVSLAATVTQLILKTLEKKERVAKNTLALVAHAVAIGRIAIGRSFATALAAVEPAGNIGVLPVTLATASDGNFYQEVEDQYALASKDIFLIASKGDISVTAPEGNVFTAAKKMSTVVEGKAYLTGETVVLEGGGPFGGKVEVGASSITLKMGVTKINLDLTGLTLQCGASSIKLGVAQINMLTQMISQRGVAGQIN